MKLFIINVGGTSTKLAVFESTTQISSTSISHSSEFFEQATSLWDQLPFRRAAVNEYLASEGIDLSTFDAIVSRGPSVKPLAAGVYHIDETMLADAKSRKYGEHPCGIGCQIALELADGKIPALTVDPPCVDEMLDVSRMTGLPFIKRKSFFQALNHKAVGHRLGKQLGRHYTQLNLVISHLGSGISVASHQKGKVIDVTNGLDGDAPFGLDRVGTLPAADWMRTILSGDYSHDELFNLLNGGGGVKAYLGTNNALEVEKMIAAGNAEAELVYDAMAFQVAKGIGAASVVFEAPVDGIILTGGIANSQLFTEKVRKRIERIAPVYIFAGEDEMLALSEGAIRGLSGEETIHYY